MTWKNPTAESWKSKTRCHSYKCYKYVFWPSSKLWEMNFWERAHATQQTPPQSSCLLYSEKDTEQYRHSVLPCSNKSCENDKYVFILQGWLTIISFYPELLCMQSVRTGVCFLFSLFSFQHEDMVPVSVKEVRGQCAARAGRRSLSKTERTKQAADDSIECCTQSRFYPTTVANVWTTSSLINLQNNPNVKPVWLQRFNPTQFFYLHMKKCRL